MVSIGANNRLTVFRAKQAWGLFADLVSAEAG